MAKLKDIFPKWLFRERSYGELELGGGSAFAHLAEDDAHSRLESDFDFLVTTGVWEDFPRGVMLFPNGALAINSIHTATEVLDLWDTAGDGNYPVFQMDGDGSLHWGDGTNPPDWSLGRDEYGGLTVLDPGGDGFAVVEAAHPDFSNHYVSLHGATGRLEISGPAAATNIYHDYVQVTTDHALSDPYFILAHTGEADNRFIQNVDGSLHWGDGTAVPDVESGRGADGALTAGATGAVAHSVPHVSAYPDGSLYSLNAEETLYSGLDKGHIYLDAGNGNIELVPSAPGVLGIAQAGGGLRLTSPDGSVTKTISIDNAGAIHVA